MVGIRGFLLIMVASLALVGCGLGGGSASTAAPAASGASDDAFQRGLAAQQANKPDDAIRLYYQALAADPSNKFALYNLGLIEQTRSHAVSAEAWYRLALENDKNMPEPLYNLALIREAVPDFNDEIGLLKRLIAIQPNNAPAHWHLGVAYRGLGQTTDANTEFATAQRLDARLTPPPASTVRPSATR